MKHYPHIYRDYKVPLIRIPINQPGFNGMWQRYVGLPTHGATTPLVLVVVLSGKFGESEPTWGRFFPYVIALLM